MVINDAQRIRVIRAMLGMSSGDFAKRLGICAGTLSAWEKGKSGPQTGKLTELSKLCHEHGIGFAPSGFPFPVEDCVVFKPKN